MAVFVWLPPPEAASSTLGLTEKQRGRVVHRGTKGSAAIACPQPIARPKVFDVGEDRVGRWIDRGSIWRKSAARSGNMPRRLTSVDVAVFCDIDAHRDRGGARREAGISPSSIVHRRTTRLFVNS